MKRRTFIKSGFLFGLGGFSAVTQSCRKSYDFDLVVRGGAVLDGTGRAVRAADIGVVGARIKAIGQLAAFSACRVIAAAGLTVAPGFIDVHSHSGEPLLINPKAESKIRQGVTTEILGQDGDSFRPDEFNLKFKKYEENGIAVNVASMVGQGTIREVVMAMTDRAATAEEIRRMQALVATALRQGAVGVSSGLEYTPGGFASTAEITELCRVMRGTHGLYATHMRNEDDRVVEAVKEAIAIARDAGIGLQISHLKCQGQRNWGKLDTIFTLIAQAQSAGVSVTMDRYPYVAFSTGLSNLMPLWSREGGTEKFIERLQDAVPLEKIKAHTLAKIEQLGSWDSVMITSVKLEKNKPLQGKTVAEIVQETGDNPFQFVKNLIIEEGNKVSMVGFGMGEENTARILAHPDCMPASDGSARATYGPLSEGNPHPRSYGTFPRFLGKYVREQNIVPLPEAIRKITSLPAQRFGFPDRGQISENFMADLVVFDASKIIDKATFSNPHQYPAGIPFVIVNGEVVIEESEHTGALPGRVLRGTIEPVAV